MLDIEPKQINKITDLNIGSLYFIEYTKSVTHYNNKKKFNIFVSSEAVEAVEINNDGMVTIKGGSPSSGRGGSILIMPGRHNGPDSFVEFNFKPMVEHLGMLTQKTEFKNWKQDKCAKLTFLVNDMKVIYSIVESNLNDRFLIKEINL